jgi:hypothetical protein
VSGATQEPPLTHVTRAHTGSRHVSPAHSEGHVQGRSRSGLVQLPPLPQVTEHTGVVQLASNHPGLHRHVSGDLHTPCTHVWTHRGTSHVGPVYPALQAHVLPPTQIRFLRGGRGRDDSWVVVAAAERGRRAPAANTERVA